MIQRYFVVEGDFDRFLLTKILPHDFVSGTRFIVGNGYNAAVSKARSVLVASELPLFLVLDSDSTDLNAVAEKRDYISQMLNQLSAPDRFRIFLFVPEIEIIFFENSRIFKKIFDTEWIYPENHPKKMLKKLLGTDNAADIKQTLESRLTGDVLAGLRENELIRKILGVSEYSGISHEFI